jgi:acetyl esterase/lipase
MDYLYVNTLKGSGLYVMLILVLLSFNGCNDGGPEAFVVNERKAYLFKKTPTRDLYLYVNEPEDSMLNKRNSAIVFFYGGGWKRGAPTQFNEHSIYLASRGMFAFQADYRTMEQDSVTPFECVEDAKSAVRWLRSHARKLGIDPNRIAAGGGSAGGHIAAACGTVKGLDKQSENLAVSSVPDALVLFNPVFDNGPKGYGYDIFGERFVEISPLHNIKEGTPPAIVFLGTEDSNIPVSTALEYKRLMEEAGSRCDLHLYEGEKHGFFNFNRGYRMYSETLLETDRFLESIGFLEGPPAIIISEEQE